MRPLRPFPLRTLVVGLATLVVAPMALVSAPSSARAADAPTNEVTIVRVAAGGASPDGTTVTSLVDTLNGAVHSFWAEQSRGAIRLHATGWADWVTTSTPCSTPAAMLTQVATAVGFQSGPGRHLVAYVSAGEGQNCPPGYGDIGEAIGTGGSAYVRTSSSKEIAHSLGHNFGLHDSTLSSCGMWEIPDCVDRYDVMGDPVQGPLGSLGGAHAAKLRVLAPGEMVSLAQWGRSGRVTLAPLSAASGVRVLRLLSGSEVWLEYRAASGRDAWLADPAQNPGGLQAGVVMRTLDSVGDATPSPNPEPVDRRVAFPVGRAVDLGSFVVSVDAQTASGATISVAPDTSAPFPREWTGDSYTDVLAVDPAGTLFVYPGLSDNVGGARFNTRRVIGKGWQNRDLLTTVGDWDWDGRPDLVARDPRNGDLWLYSGDDAGGFLGWRVIGRGWNAFDALISPGDWDGDGYVDLVARVRADGRLLLYPGNGRGGFKPSRQIGTGWQVMTAIVASGDFDLDGFEDLLARHRDGTLYQYRGNGAGGFLGRVVVGGGWQTFNSIIGTGGWPTGSGHTLLARRTDGTLWAYYWSAASESSDGRSRFAAPQQVGSGWSGFRLAA